MRNTQFLPNPADERDALLAENERLRALLVIIEANTAPALDTDTASATFCRRVAADTCRRVRAALATAYMVRML